MAKYPPENPLDGGFGRRYATPDADRRLNENQDNLEPKDNLYAPNMQKTGITPEFGSNRAADMGEGYTPLFRPGSLRASAWMQAPFDAIASPEGCETEVREIDIYQYGDGYDPKSPMKVVNTSWSMDTDFDGETN